MPIRFHCPSGHKIKAADRLAGQSSRCPGCGVEVIVPGAEALDPMTETGALRILNECDVPETATRVPAARADSMPHRACPRCSATLSSSARICWSCRLDVGPTIDAWKSVLRAASRHVRGRRAS
jgi:hypothetical protein